MGQTLTHGIYLPDEGERNCYDGLASNWQLLDNSVGTIAEHTTALAGKAPAVHTHTKSDVTDLFNSANTWSALNSYSNGQIRIKSLSQEIGVIPSSSVIQYLEFADKNDAQHGIVGLWDYSNGASEIQMYITDKFKNGAKDPTGTTETTILSFGFKTDGSKFLTFSGQVDNSVIPKTNNTYDIGTSSFKWKTLNGINPGALSLPKIVAKTTADISSAIVGSDGETQYLDGTDNSYTAALDGWISICISGFTQSNELWITVYDMNNETWGTSAESSTRNTMFIIFPVRANQKMRIRMKCTSVTYARFYPCEGNV